MLQSQVNYWTLQENKRHNLAMEELQRAANSIARYDVDVKAQNVSELGRHNVAMEGETSRHNVRTEQQQDTSLNLGYFNAYENQRANMASEAIRREDIARGYAQIALGYAQNAVASRQADAAEKQASVASRNVAARNRELAWQKEQFRTTYDQEYQLRLKDRELRERELDIRQQEADTRSGGLLWDVIGHSSIQYTSPVPGGFTTPQLPMK